MTSLIKEELVVLVGIPFGKLSYVCTVIIDLDVLSKRRMPLAGAGARC